MQALAWTALSPTQSTKTTKDNQVNNTTADKVVNDNFRG